MAIHLYDRFDYRKLVRFVLPSIVMMVFSSIYGVVDGLFVSNFVGKTAFASVNIIFPFITKRTSLRPDFFTFRHIFREYESTFT